ncbi:MAG: hypothetical protein CMC05_10665 [Flavobacteriaceae bacterium]|uniref:DUF6452 family protein n=1 Tax=Winogradskyella poriferorum TaxID=307627 RepID=UPI000C99539D|nr:hypothetical protein [Flavobacteriaceae bacterium]|tara:strand:+ start:333 stop:884 length:552 start_codon:yes stop_codon:yes gene_type:complete
MKKLKFTFLLLLVALISCERDDICAETTPTTPRLMVEFYDATETEELKPVTRLTAYGEGLANNPTNDNTEGTLVYNTNATAIELPLLIGNEGEITTSRFILEKDTNLRLDEDVDTDSNIDIIEISYETEFVYVSRACGYKSIFKNLQVSFETSDDGAWISGIEVVDTVEIVENENTVHVRILH